MKYVFAAMFAFGSMFGQFNGIQWQKSIGGSAPDKAYDIHQVSDGGYIVAGISYSSNGNVTGSHGDSDGWVAKLSATGALLWQKTFGGTADDGFSSIQQTTDGGYIIAGSTASADGDLSFNNGFYDVWVIKTDATGNIQWQRVYGGSNLDEGASAQQTSDGGFIVAGSSYSTDGDVTGNHGSSDYWVLRLDASGQVQWQKSLGGSSSDYGSSVRQTSDGGYVVAGSTSSSDGNVTGSKGSSDYWLVKLNATGSFNWAKTYGGTDVDAAASILQAVGGYIIAGYTGSTNGDVTGSKGLYDYWIIKTDISGTIQWQKTFGGTSLDQAASIKPTTDGGYIVAGVTFSSDGDVTGLKGSADYWLIKLTSSGMMEWQKTFGGTGDDVSTYGNDQATCIQQTTDGGYIVAGYSDSNDGDVSGNHGAEDFWIVKLNASVGIDELSVKDTYTVYPVPVTDLIHVHCKINEQSMPYVLTDVLGAVILRGTLDTDASTINISNFQPGVYFLRIGYTSDIVKIIKQ